MDYLRSHWQGKQPLARSFWVNFALLFLMISGLAQLIYLPIIDQIAAFMLLTGAYIFIGCLLVYPWQLIGLIRACDRYLADNRGTGWTGAVQRVTAIQGAMIASLMVTGVTWFALLQHGVGLHALNHKNKTAASDRPYMIEIKKNGHLIQIDGEFAPGLSKNLEKLLKDHADVKGIILKSDGGRVYEARGVARLISEHQLETHVYDHCRSACTTAFIAGSKRYLGVDGRLGFHRYLLQSVLPKIDVATEQEKDRAFFRARGVEPVFLEKLFSTPHDSIWHPDVDELLQSNVVHEMVEGSHL